VVLPIDKLVEGFRCTVAEIEKDGLPVPPVLANPLSLLLSIRAGEGRRTQNEKRLGVPVPRFCIFSVTWLCNLRCIGCYASQYKRGPGLPLDELRRIIGEASELGMFLFVIVGGEPLLVPGLLDVLAERNDALFFFFTNGTLLTDEHAKAMAASPNIIPIISTEGDQELTDSRRGGGVGAKVAAAMALLRGRNAAFGFASMVTHRNVETVTSRRWCEALWKAGARFGFLIDYVPFPHGLDKSLVLTDEDRAAKLAAVGERQKEARPLVLNFPPDEYDAGGCQAAGRGFLHINADGWVEPCPFSHYAADNLVEKSLTDVLRSGFFRRLRELVAGTPNPKGECLLFAHDEEVQSIAAETGAFRTDAPPDAK